MMRLIPKGKWFYVGFLPIAVIVYTWIAVNG